MMRKIIIFLMVTVAVAILADYAGFISLPSFEKSATLENRDQLTSKTDRAIDNR